jgi:hypothetical protein
MVGLVPNVRFLPTAGGTSQFTYSSAVQGYQSPSAAGASAGTTYQYFAASLDLSQWEIGQGNWDGTNLARTTVLWNSSGTGTASGQSGAGSQISFNTVPTVAFIMLPSDLLQMIGEQTITGGFAVTPNNIGTASGTVTPNPLLGNYQYLTNAGAFTLAAPSSDCAIDILFTNGSGAGAVTFSGFTVNSFTGDPLTTTSGSKFLVSIRRINGTSTYLIKALQ